MSGKNYTKVSEFFLLGLGNLHDLNVVFFIVFLIIFVFTITGNLVIIVLVSITPALQSPMYYLLGHLSLSDLLISTNILPNLLGSLLLGREVITYSGCITQFYFFSATTVTECFLLSVMSYDRYLAICNPLRYSSIMDMMFCVNLSAWPWLSGFTLNLLVVLPVSEFDFCADNVIDHFYCDLYPLQKLSCSDTFFVELEVIVFSMPIFIVPCGFIVVTYIYIFHTVFSIPSTTGKQKAFSTCSSHLLVVGTFYGTLIAKYMIPSNGYSLLLIKIVSLLHTVFTPLFNPIIYSLRNQDIRTALQKLPF
ncbi:PREDICTED: olfactory receptor 11L1-like [Nanorana parkeri]|uniref:olfactory receptor 11L1-like n=1 Tax=Nanorana parkeri TaxID=125878 RepID=UPI000854CE51|nr:PREDICTED: olfactory receptor 11L1-like [Nanorana parkeri]